MSEEQNNSLKTTKKKTKIAHNTRKRKKTYYNKKKTKKTYYDKRQRKTMMRKTKGSYLEEDEEDEEGLL